MQSHFYKWRHSEYEVTRSICWSPPGCHGGCGVLLYCKNGRLVKIEGDPHNRFNNGRLCIRGMKAAEAMYHPQRVKYPLLRAGRRGENHWRRINFDEAVEIISQKFSVVKNEFGAESVIFCKGTARDIGGWLSRLCYGFGSPNYFGLGPGSGNACYRPRVAASTAVMGGLPVPDLGQFDNKYSCDENHPSPRCILIWGANPIDSNPDGLFGGWITDLMKKGTEIIVVDPQRTRLASKAKHHLRVKPGTDAALALGMLNVIFESGLIDQEFCPKWVLGLEDVKTVAEDYPPGKAAALTGLNPNDITEAARFFAGNKPANLVWGVAIDMNPGCLGTIQSLISLMALTGNIENPGGMVIPGGTFGVKRRGDDISDFPNIKVKRIGAHEYPLLEIGSPYAQPDILLDQMETGEPYPIKAAWIQGAGVIPSAFADPERVLNLFKSLDFNVMVDVFLNPAAAAFADIVLPAAMYPEKDSVYVHFSQLAAVNKAVEPPGDCKSDAEIILALGKKLAPDYFTWNDVREWLGYRLAPSGITFAQLRESGSLTPPIEYAKYAVGKLRKNAEPGFETPSGKIELNSSILKKCGLNPLPHYEDYTSEYRNRFGKKKYPYILTTGARKPYFFCAEHRNIESLRRLQPEPLAKIHPQDASKSGVNDGDYIKIYSPFGSCAMKAEISGSFPPGVVHCDSGWWFPEKDGAEPNLFGVRGVNVNALLPSGLQGPGGFGYPFRCFICNIKKIDDNDTL